MRKYIVPTKQWFYICKFIYASIEYEKHYTKLLEKDMVIKESNCCLMLPVNIIS